MEELHLGVRSVFLNGGSLNLTLPRKALKGCKSVDAFLLSDGTIKLVPKLLSVAVAGLLVAYIQLIHMLLFVVVKFYTI